MDLFSSSAEDTIKKKVTCLLEEPLVGNDADIVDFFNLKNCLLFIKKSSFVKVCLQFPDNLLQYSVQAALWLENQTKEKVFVLGDTSYGSCCVDELAAEHIGGDTVIHMGHACLSPTSRLPVLYVLPRASLDLPLFISAFTDYCSSCTDGPVLLLYDVAYSHLVDEIRASLRQFEGQVVISQLCIPDCEPQQCGPGCELNRNSSSHQTRLLGRAFCCHTPGSVVYIAHKNSQNVLNFALTFRDVQFFTYTAETGTRTFDFNKTLRRRLYLVEKVKDAKTIGIIVGTLSIDNFLGAIDRVKKLAAYRGKRCYVFSVGKPNPAKLANFPEIEVFVLVSCPEACLENEKEYLQPVVTVLEAELALNSSRRWDDKLSVDFRDLLDGSLPKGHEPLAADVSLISNKIRSDVVVDDSGTGTEVSVKEHYLISADSSYNSGRSWRGLEQALGETSVSQTNLGRSGIPLAYEEEKPHQQS